jgi:hypothetical protein
MRLRALAIAAVVSLAVCGLAAADESPSWFMRLFQKAPEKTKDDPVKGPTKADLDLRIVQAQADLQRRQDVCDRLLEVAEATGDEALRRKAEQLNQRCVEAYTATVGRPTGRQTPIAVISSKDLRDAEKKAKGGR